MDFGPIGFRLISNIHPLHFQLKLNGLAVRILSTDLLKKSVVAASEYVISCNQFRQTPSHSVNNTSRNLW